MMKQKTHICLVLLLLGIVAHTASAHTIRREPATDASPSGAATEAGLYWEWEPAVLVPLLLTLCFYGVGVVRMWQGAGLGHGVRIREVGCFLGGWLILFLSLISPLHAWGNLLFSAHMVQHELLMLGAGPLLVLSKPLTAFLRGLPAAWARAASQWTRQTVWQTSWRFLTHPFVAWLLHGIVLWAWHVPFLFQAALEHEWVHSLQHLSFLASALLFWWAVVHGKEGAMGYGAGVLYMFTTALHSSLLGVLITFSRTLWYSGYRDTTAAWGLTPLEDQQLGGLIMWIPACTVYLFAGMALFAGWLRAADERVRHWEAALGPTPPSPRTLEG